MISSVGNPKVKRIVSLQSRGREREKEKVFVTEGKKMFMEAPVSWIREIYLAQDKRERMEDGDFLERLRVCKEGGAVLETVSGEVFAKMSDTMAPQGILCVLGRPRFDRERILEKALRQKEEKGRPPLFLLLEDIQDPGNLGTMIRTAEGAGADALFMTGGTVDIYNPKTIRATMGSLYRVPFFYVDGLKETIELLRQRGITVYAAHLKGEKFYQEMDYAGGSAFLIGNEARGLRQETAECADCFLRIPMEGELESLNAAVAAALLMYQSRFEKNREKKQEEKGKAREMKIGFIGMGNMAKAMIGGILAKGKAAKEDIIGSAKTEATRKEMAGRYGIRTEADNREVAKVSDLLVLAVKPQFFEEVISQIRKDVRDETIVVSIAAGRTIEGIEGMFGRKLKLVRCMPNTPALVGEGCSGVCRSGLVTEEEMARCMELVESFGLAREVPERLINAVSGVSGCSPAYVFLFIEALADGAVAAGMPRAQAYTFAAQAVMGSAKLMLETGKHPGELKDMVCSPAGTTIEGVRVLEERGFRGAVMDAVKASVEKAENM